MNATVIVIEILSMCLIFGFLVFGLLYLSPLTFISDYPPEIQKAYYRNRFANPVINKGYYKSQHKEALKEKLTIVMKAKKAVAVIAYLFLAAWMLHIAGAETFVQGLLLSYAYTLCLFAWDTLFLDWVLFANIKRIRLPGTEHMDKEYHQKWFHVKACLPMIPVFAAAGVITALIMIWLW